jgi:hypothetical protein
MASPLRYTLVSDGTTDRALLPIINWLLLSIPDLAERGIEAQWADWRRRDKTPGLAGKVEAALHDYPCDLLFVHRDAEASVRAIREQRQDEIQRALEPHSVPYVGIVPVRMTEAWLLIDAEAICKAADNPHCQERIALPSLRRLEPHPDPKQLLHELLERASEKKGRRLEQFRRDLSWRRVRVAELISDFSPLFQLSAFAQFAEETLSVCQKLTHPKG